MDRTNESGISRRVLSSFSRVFCCSSWPRSRKPRAERASRSNSKWEVGASFNRLTTVLLRRRCNSSSSSGPPSPSALRSNEPNCNTSWRPAQLSSSKAMVLLLQIQRLLQDPLQVLAGGWIQQVQPRAQLGVDLGRKAHDSSSLRSSGSCKPLKRTSSCSAAGLRGTEPRLIVSASRPWVRVRSACDRDNGAAGQMVAPVSLEFATCRPLSRSGDAWSGRNPVFGAPGVQPPWARQHHNRLWFGPGQRRWADLTLFERLHP